MNNQHSRFAKFLLTLAFLTIITLLVGFIAKGQGSATPHLIPLQGYVTDNSDNPIASGDLRVEVYEIETGGVPVWVHNFTGAVQDGVFDVLLGSAHPMLLDNTQLYWISVFVNMEEVIGEYTGGRQSFYPGGGSHSNLQNRVSGTCSVGSSIRAINADGTVTCEADDNTLYIAGFGLDLVATTFQVDVNDIQSRVFSTCPPGSSIRTINADGTVACEVDSDTVQTFSSIIRTNSGTGASMVQCNVGEVLTGGGGTCIGNSIERSYPMASDTWRVDCTNSGATANVYAVCSKLDG